MEVVDGMEVDEEVDGGGGGGGMEWNGMEVEWSGVEWNGME